MSNIGLIKQFIDLHPDCPWVLRPMSDEELARDNLPEDVGYVLEIGGANIFVASPQTPANFLKPKKPLKKQLRTIASLVIRSFPMTVMNSGMKLLS